MQPPLLAEEWLLLLREACLDGARRARVWEGHIFVFN